MRPEHRRTGGLSGAGSERIASGIHFSARVVQAGRVTTMRLQGEIDIVAVLELHPVLREFTSRPAPALAIDLRPVTFIDCTGLTMLVEIRRYASVRGARVGVVCDDPRALRTMAVVGLSTVLCPGPTPEAALAAERAGAPLPAGTGALRDTARDAGPAAKRPGTASSTDTKSTARRVTE
ncbi:STAS domain-containing protein [Streptomyces daliensis]|uniref:Anti-sigma factor antagonist n=1 Tax=Streptomyces daliensis TaxID=299421 RepID=A0A8T4IX97_9ACTN|nr:STAS domain-containing protein [Streptomyces daliensis]